MLLGALYILLFFSIIKIQVEHIFNSIDRLDDI
jgi:hypothetical protein